MFAYVLLWGGLLLETGSKECGSLVVSKDEDSAALNFRFALAWITSRTESEDFKLGAPDALYT